MIALPYLTAPFTGEVFTQGPIEWDEVGGSIAEPLPFSTGSRPLTITMAAAVPEPPPTADGIILALSVVVRTEHPGAETPPGRYGGGGTRMLVTPGPEEAQEMNIRDAFYGDPVPVVPSRVAGPYIKMPKYFPAGVAFDSSGNPWAEEVYRDSIYHPGLVANGLFFTASGWEAELLIPPAPRVWTGPYPATVQLEYITRMLVGSYDAVTKRYEKIEQNFTLVDKRLIVIPVQIKGSVNVGNGGTGVVPIVRIKK